MTADEEAVHAMFAAVDEDIEHVHRCDSFYSGITFRAPADEPCVSMAEFADAVRDEQASPQQYGAVYMRLVENKRQSFKGEL